MVKDLCPKYFTSKKIRIVVKVAFQEREVSH